MRGSPLVAGIAGVAAGTAVLLTRAHRRRRRAERFAAAALESLLRAIDANDAQTGAHVRRVARYALIIADALGVDENERRTIELTALFHDIGKIHEALFDIVHDHHALTAEERRAIATHPQRGADVLAPIAYFHEQLAEAVLAHHERWDGSGYPRGVAGRRIPRAARVVTLADTFDAITHRRRYRDGKTAGAAAEIILAGRGTQFDPELVDLMMLPPVFAELTRAHRQAMRPSTLRHRSNARGSEKAPRVRIRWRTRTELPRSVREKVTRAS
ncbi:MAG TPA: HD domain-containing phosphohydrolase [Gemmatimonadaceae bacterium]|nr:HD domain-containing phosphohydrolase [Gemmatimonadaceae bacterium]